MNLSIENVDTKKSLRIVWIVEGALLFIMCFVVLLFFPDRTDGLIQLSPYLFGLIALQATGAIGGSNFKRLTEGYKLKQGAKNGVPDIGRPAGGEYRGLGADASKPAEGGAASQGRRNQGEEARRGDGATQGGLP